MNRIIAFLVFAAVLTGLYSCRSGDSSGEVDSLYRFREYIRHHTSGRQSVVDPIVIELIKPLDQFDLAQELPADYLKISPRTSGKLVIENGTNLMFVPDEKLKADTEYTVTLKLDKLYDDLSKDFRSFSFSFKTLTPNFKINTEDLQSYSQDWQYINGSLESNEILTKDEAAGIIRASQNKQNLKVSFTEPLPAARHFSFVIDSIRRFEEDSELLISWDGKSIKSKNNGEAVFPIPGKSNFSILSINAAMVQGSFLKINFSDPLVENQNFNGLVSIQDRNNLRFEVNGNVLSVYPEDRITGAVLVEIFEGISSVYGYKLKKNFSELIAFEQLKPALRAVSKGAILPGSASTPFYFEAVNLNAVEVRIIKIFQDNILQYLQTSNLGDQSTYNLNTVGRRIAKKTIQLESTGLENDGVWKAYGLNLSEYFKADPGAIYRVELSFKKEHTAYNCEPALDSTVSDEFEDDYYYDEYDSPSQDLDEEEREEQYWNNKIYRWRTYSYNWEQRDNPCHAAYYNEERVLSTNVLGSDLGFIAKSGGNKTYRFITTNLLTTNPEGGVKISLYNFQKQLIGELTTEADGMVTHEEKQHIAFAVAQKNNNYAYLKLEDGNMLSLSNFDISGKELQKGLKGYIYKDRGVHRPGDTIHLTFALNDLGNPLPAGHPVTLEVSDAQGKIVQKTVAQGIESNLYYFPISTEADSPTGNWRATVHVGGAKFSEVLRVATVKPNRLKINLDFDEEVLSAAKPIRGTATVNWLHGAIAKNLDIEMEATIRSTSTAFKDFPEYVFTDPIRTFEETEVSILKGKVDAAGKISIFKELELNKNAPGMLRASILTKVFEGGGDFSLDVFTKDIAPFSHFVGLKSPKAQGYGSYFTDENTRFEVVSVDENGKPVGNRDLQVKVYRIEWRWWWSRGGDNLSTYENASLHRPFKDINVSTDATGKANFELAIPEEESGRYLIRVIDPKSGHATGRVTYFYRNWWASAGTADAESAKMLIFSADKEKYNVGDKAVIKFPSGTAGRALLSIENGTKVLATKWVETQKGETQTTLEITKEMAPNIFVNISLLQPHEQTANDLPIRLYGVIPILVEDPSTVLSPVLELPQVLKPEENYVVKVSEQNRKPMSYTIAVVDEGLLDLTRFRTPEIHSAFYTKEALGVKTFDMYDDVIGAYSGSVENIYAIGGSDDAAGAKNRKADRFKPVVTFLGPFTLKAGEKVSHTLKMPNYVGSVRAMVVAADNSIAAYGSADKTVPVRKPLMVLASLPRKLSPGEKVTLPVTVFAMENKVKKAKVTVKTSKGLKAIGGNSKTVSFSAPGEQIVNFDYEVNDIGIQTIEISASGSGEEATYQIEIDVENPNPVTHSVKDLNLEPNATQTFSFSTFGEEGSNAAFLEFSTLPPMDFTRRMQYLIQYPHGCVEQTTSAAFPQLFLADIFDVTLDRKQQIHKNVEAAIRKISTYQNPDGGLGYWPGARDADEWSTNYVGHFMLEAKRKGYALPLTFLSSWLRFQQSAARQWRTTSKPYNTSLIQAYRLYTLALAGEPELAAMNRLRETDKLGNDAKWRLAAAYSLAGQERVAKELIATAVLDFQPSTYDYYTYGSPFRNRALALETMVLIGEAKQRDLATSLAKDLSSSRWFSTQETSYALIALSKMVEKNGGKQLEVSFTQNGKTATVKTHQAISQRELTTSMGENTVTVKNAKDNLVYVRLIQSGKLPVGEELDERRNLQVVAAYLDGEGKKLDPSSVRQGSQITAQIRVENTSADFIANVALSQLFPSGWEIVNTSFTEMGGGAKGNASYTDIRDDRVYFYFDLNSKESRTFTVKLNASYLGSYYLPGSQAEGMYDNTYFARTKGQWVVVEK
ncbi:MG2 domain-containing protein [Algoriphagus sp. AGSA1]|uniref:alpha-2-macroglobulin family protein n=1 Tax=Algoriphagus sp. AGSA1 TaxID=2907213 RepID=UPI001F3883C1|nr:MG2 domain-containing protein [Algoriphagus sp. AGSA1]MCE7054167.1 MG2 domain-containing protein [Algoriphagus sp. AGSA1]